jgi:peptidoglycan/LPS O-acetylase OafA/YrhL
MSLGTALGALLQLALVALIGWPVGNFVLDRILKDREIEWPERALAAVMGFIAFSVAVMILHIVSGGAAFGARPMVPLFAVGALGALVPRVRRPRGVPWRAVAIAVLVLGLVYVVPAVVGGSGVRTGDPPWHLGWTEQLLAGEPVPTGPAAAFGRNAYPWGFHAVMATMVRLVPGSTPIVALEALHALIVLTIPLAAACLARLVRRSSGWAAAGATAFAGGFGWLIARGADFVPSPSEARYGADLVVASPNSVYELFPPALPRELALVALGAAGWLIAVSLAAPDRRASIAAGIAVGSVGLISVPLFVSALVWMIAAIPFVRGMSRLRWLTLVALPALGIFALWAGPVVSAYVRYGGFVNITPRLGVEWPLPVALASWGLLFPACLAGIWIAVKSARGSALLAFVLGTVVLLGLAVARGRLGWTLGGNATLLHQGRVWPPAHLLGGALAGIALAAGWNWLRARGRTIAVVGGAAVFAIASASPVLASIELTRIISSRESGYEYTRSDLGPGSFVRRTAALLDPSDVVLVEGSDELAFYLFQLSGVRIAEFDDPRLEGNDLRIRYKDLAESWDASMANLGFDPDYLVVAAPSGPVPNAVVAGEFAGHKWVLLKLSD